MRRSIFYICLLFPCVLRAQDRICLENEVRQGKVTDLTLSSLRYIPADKPAQSMLLPMDKVLILFNADGGYLVPSQLDTNDKASRGYLGRFFAAGGHGRGMDAVFTLQHTTLDVVVTKEDDDYIYWGDNGKMNKKDVAAIIYGNGTPKIFCPMNQAALVLGTSRGTPLNLAVGADMIATTTGGGGHAADAAVGGAGTAPVVAAGDNAAAEAANNANDSAARALVARLLGDISPKDFESKAEKKTAQFTDYLKILCDKGTGYEELEKAIRQAITLFVNEDATIEVSSNNRLKVNRWKIREYLNKVKAIQYDRIEIRWTHVQYVGDLKLGADGNLYGTVSFEQEFRGYRDNQLVYSDVTIKNANVVLKTYDKTYEGTTQKIWDVLLSDVGVSATKSL
jgi:hypothetical protein